MNEIAAQPLRIECEKQSSPLVWISEVLSRARGRHSEKVGQRLIGATLVLRYPDREIPNFRGNATNVQSEGAGDFPFETVTYHATTTDGRDVIARCKQNLESGILPVLLVPRANVVRAILRAENEGISDRISVLAIQDFITQNIVELSTETGEDFFTTLQAIVSEYNRRLEEAETDMSLKIEIR